VNNLKRTHEIDTKAEYKTYNMKTIDLFLKEGFSITVFAVGDIITRVIPKESSEDQYNENLGIATTVQLKSDSSWLGDPFKYIGIYNNQIWLEHSSGIFKGKISRLDLHEWSDGWDKFELPNGITIEQL